MRFSDRKKERSIVTIEKRERDIVSEREIERETGEFEKERERGWG